MAANLPPESERVIAGDNKYNIGDPVLQLPQLFNAMLDGKRDTLKIFHLWNQIINLTFQMRVPDEERTKSFGELSAKLYKDLTLRMPPLKSRRKRKFHIPETEENSAFKKLDLDLENAPSGDVLERLHKQLGSIASTRAIEEPVKSDCMMLRTMGMRVREFNSGDLQDEYVPYPLIETNHEEQEEEEDEDDMINPSDFLEVQQSWILRYTFYIYIVLSNKHKPNFKQELNEFTNHSTKNKNILSIVRWRPVWSISG